MRATLTNPTRSMADAIERETDTAMRRAELARLMADAMGALRGARDLLPSERRELAKRLISMPSITGQGIFRTRTLADGSARLEINSVELTSRMMRLLDSAVEAERATSERPRAHKQTGGWNRRERHSLKA